jgi:membrane associated rhomboid family serine protease
MSHRGAQMFGGGGFPPIPPATRVLLFVLVGLSLLNVFAARWLGVLAPAEFLALEPGAVLHGQVWRLVTHPWVAVAPFELIFSGFALYLFGGQLEDAWGPRRYVQRLALLVAVPSALVVLLSLALPSLAGAAFLGMPPVTIALVVAFATRLGHRQIMMFPLPFVLSGDGLLYLEAGFLALYVLFAGTVLGFVPELLAFGFALAWFRFGLFQGWGRRWLLFRRSRLEARLKRLRRRSGLRVVEDDEGEPRRWLN